MPQVHVEKSKAQKARPVVAVVVICLLVGLASAAVYFLWPHRAVAKITVAGTAATENTASQLAASKGPQAGLSYYATNIPNAASSQVKADLYLMAANLALTYKLNQTALTDAMKADAMLHSAASSSLIAQIYVAMGNDTQAIAYYKKAAAEVDPNQIAGDSSQYYLSEADALSAGGTR